MGSVENKKCDDNHESSAILSIIGKTTKYLHHQNSPVPICLLKIFLLLKTHSITEKSIDRQLLGVGRHPCVESDGGWAMMNFQSYFWKQKSSSFVSESPSNETCHVFLHKNTPKTKRCFCDRGYIWPFSGNTIPVPDPCANKYILS